MSIIESRKGALTFISMGSEKRQWDFVANPASRAVGDETRCAAVNQIYVLNQIYVPLIFLILRCRTQPL